MSTAPCATIQGAVSKAQAGNTVLVATGTYTSTAPQVLSLDRSLTLLGAWDNAFTSQGSQLSVLDAQGVGGRSGVVVNNSVNVTLNGFVVQGGNAPQGAGISNSGALTLANSVVFSNSATTTAGGVYNAVGGTLVVQNSTIHGNVAPDGGGLANAGAASLQNTTIANNTA